MKCVCGCTTNGVNDNFCADCGGVLAFEEKPEFLYKYRKVLEKFIRDGELSQKDMKQLNSLQKKWKAHEHPVLRRKL